MSVTSTGRLQSTSHELGPWFHNLHLPDGTATAPDHPLGDFPSFKWEAIAPHLPADLTGWRALDIGCNAGFFTFELAKRGAEVTALDIDPHYLRQAEWAAEQFGLSDAITFRQGTVYDLARLDEDFDLVWFMGVFYHLRYPQLALDLVAERTRRLLVFQTLTFPQAGTVKTPLNLRIEERDRMLESAWPKMAFVEHQFEDDPTNWWVANEACVRALLRSSGMKIVRELPDLETYVCEPAARDSWTRNAIQRECRNASGRG
jgi:tRNA (mo5U34)-methyltransferase